MTVTLWEAKVEQFQAALSGTGDVPVFAVVSGLLAKKFAGNKITPILFKTQDIIPQLTSHFQVIKKLLYMYCVLHYE